MAAVHTARLAARLAALSQPWCPAGLVHDLLGVDVVGDPGLAAAFCAWASRFLGQSEVARATPQGPLVHRHALERFLVQNGLVSWKWAAVYLGMAADTLREVVECLEGNGVSTQITATVSNQLVRQRDAALLLRAFPALRHRTFFDHSLMCRVLHAAIRDDLAIAVSPVRCVTSVLLDPEEPSVAVAFDAISLEPVGLRYQVWLETNKPVNLPPDVCSLLLYARNEAALHDRVMKASEPAQIDQRLLVA